MKTVRRNSIRTFYFALLLFGSNVPAEESYVVETVAEGLKNPWSIAFLPDRDALVTELGGNLRLIEAGRLRERAIDGLPRIRRRGQGGLMGVALHPDFATNRLVYLSYTGSDKAGYSTEVLRAQYTEYRLNDIEVIFTAAPRSPRQKHFGGRLQFDARGDLYITLGDRGDRMSAQDTGNHNGALVRVRPDGSVPDDNPYVGVNGSRDEIFNHGHRNIQGIAVHPRTGVVWTHEHGPQGGDEINIEYPQRNYGWPVITYGVNYGLGTKIGEGTAKPGLEQPIHKWIPSIAPAGMTFYSGDVFHGWRGNLFVGSLKFGQLVRLEVSDDGVLNEERMFNGEYGRIRDVVEGPDGLLYFLTDQRNGRLMRLAPPREQ